MKDTQLASLGSLVEAVGTSAAQPLLTSPPRRDGQTLELAVVLPTYKESANLRPVIQALDRVLNGIEWEVIIVDDDSPDGTAELARELAATHTRVRVVHRVGRRGLASACIEGMLATPARYIAVMDADLQHDERVLPEMFDRIRSGEIDLVVASRNLAGGSMGAFAQERVRLSTLGARLAHMVCPAALTDPMSGFFVLDRCFFEEVMHRLSGIGFKILVDLVASAQRPVRFAEVPYRFRNREHGESKLDVSIELEYLYLLIDKLVGRFVPTRFVLFVAVGALGLLLHLGVLAACYLGWGMSLISAQMTATAVAMAFNFLLNNLVTFREYRLRGWRILTGLATFYAACSIGALVNVGFADSMARHGAPWYLAGICGMSVSAVWNYGVNTVLTWKRGRRT
jgi:dolichol-phosphate mannosyltransferase